jgi:hypothetical protein
MENQNRRTENMIHKETVKELKRRIVFLERLNLALTEYILHKGGFRK